MKITFPKSTIRNNFLLNYTSCFLIITSHFINYTFYIQYKIIFPDLILFISGLGCVALALAILLEINSLALRLAIFTLLLTVIAGDAIFEYGVAETEDRLIAISLACLTILVILFFLREHADKILVAGCLAFFTSTVALGLGTTNALPVPQQSTDAEPIDPRPTVVHLILDEHIGLAGISDDLPGGREIRNALQEFYLKYGFRINSGAYSQFFRTAPSLTTALNFETTGAFDSHLKKNHYGYSINSNKLLKFYYESGYNINIYQSNYITFCDIRDVITDNCLTYFPDTFSSSEVVSLSISDRISLLSKMYFSSIALVKLAVLAEPHIHDWMFAQGIALPRLPIWHGRVGPIAVMPTLRQLTADVARSRGGEIFFAHLLMPHYPYVYRANCDIRTPTSTWQIRLSTDREANAASRRARYTAYFEQVRCLMKKLETLFAEMKKNGTFAASKIIVHGDHGSRLGLVDPSASTLTSMSPDDYYDSYSTLFAFKAPGLEAGIDQRMIPLPHLLATTVFGERSSLALTGVSKVYVPDKGTGILSVDLPKFQMVPPFIGNH
jgi:hypothetical protein